MRCPLLFGRKVAMAPGRGVWRERRRARDSERDIASRDRQEDRCCHRPCLDRSCCQLRDGVRSCSPVRPLPRGLSLRWFLELFASSIRMRLRADVHCGMDANACPTLNSVQGPRVRRHTPPARRIPLSRPVTAGSLTALPSANGVPGRRISTPTRGRRRAGHQQSARGVMPGGVADLA